MATKKLNFQVGKEMYQKLQTKISQCCLPDNNKLQVLFDVKNNKYFGSWFKKKRGLCTIDVISINPCDVTRHEYTTRKSSCRKRVPECPEYVSCGGVRCDDGAPIKKGWFSFEKQLPKKERGHNCPVAPGCRKQTFMEYIFGEKEPLPDPETCRRVYKQKQECMENDSRLCDPRYKATDGDVLIYTELQKFEYKKVYKPEAAPPPLLRLPAPVICKKVSDSISCMDCYCACVAIPQEPCQSNLCPAHQKPYRFPYDEMKPRNRRVKYLEHKQQCWDPSRNNPCWNSSQREACECATYPTDKTPCNHFMNSRQEYTLSEAVDRAKRDEQTGRQEQEPSQAGQKMSRCQRLSMLLANTDVALSLPEYSPRNPLALPENRCEPCVKE